MRKINCVVVDDELIPNKWLTMILTEKFDQINLLGTADSVSSSLELLSSTKPDLVFLDIELGDGNAFDMLNQLEKVDFSIVFTTSHNKYAINAIKFSALDYLIKPIILEELKICINRFNFQKFNTKKLSVLSHNYLNSESQENKIILPHNSGFDFLKISEIIYCKSDVNYTYIKTNSETFLVSKPLKEYDELLSQYDFFRIHQSYLINSRHLVKYIRSKTPVVVMTNGEHLNVSRAKREDFINFLKR